VVCKLSIVLPGSGHGGAIIDTPAMPAVGDFIPLGDLTVEVLEVQELLPPRGEFRFVHVTGRVVEDPANRPAPGAPPGG
jgi:hypothetical protein